MNQVSATPPVRFIRFGLFEADLHAGELRKNGLKIKLQDQPFRVLSLLLERAGEVVTREELREKLWSADTFVDFEHSLNGSVKKLRQALGDLADNPRFVETLARRGYRFIAPVEPVGEGLSKPNLAVDKVTYDSVSPVSPAELLKIEKEQIPRWTAGWTWVAVLSALILAGAGWLYFLRSASLPPMNVVRFTSHPGKEKDPALSPDGARLAFVWDGQSGDNFDVYVQSVGQVGELPLTTEKPLRLTTAIEPDLSPAWSPDGDYVAFVRAVSDMISAVYVMSSMGGEEKKLTELYSIWSEGKSLDWSPDGKFLVTAGKELPTDPYSLFLISLDTRELQKLTAPTQQFGDILPTYSPDGQSLAFTRFWTSDFDLYLLPLSHGQPERLTQNAGGWTSAWTADGKEIVFSLRGGANYRNQLWRVSVSGSKPQLLGIGSDGAAPTIARQRNRLAYVETTYDTDIWRIELPDSKGRGIPPTRLALNSSQEDVDPQYSPDGKNIAFVSSRSGSYEIWVCDREGQNARRLTSFSGARVTGNPRWSADGRQIAFNSGEAGRSEVFVVGLEGGSPRCLTEKTADGFLPNWSQDGRWIYFGSHRSGSMEIWRMPAEGGEAIRVTKNSGFEGMVAPDGKTLYYSKLQWRNGSYGSAQIWRVPLPGGEETQVLSVAVHARYWTLTERGIYFIRSDSSSSPAIEFFSFSTGRVTQVVVLEKPPVGGANPGLSISPDGRWILCALVQQDTSDIMLVENFR